MSEKMAIEVMGRVPVAIIVYTLLSGALLLLLSPVRLYLSTSIGLIFSGENTLNYLVALSVFSLLGGIPMLLLREPVYGTGGLNEWMAKRIWKKKKTEKTEEKESLTFAELEIKSTQLAIFVKWIKETEISHFLELINVEAYLLSALIMASEVCIPLNIFGLMVGKILLSQQSSSFELILLTNLGLSLIIGFISWIYEKYYFRDYKKKRLTFIGKSFQEVYPELLKQGFN